AKSVQVLVGHPVAHGLAAQLTEGSGITLARAAPANLPPARQLAYFEGRGAKALAQAAARSDAVITLRSLWPQDPLFPLARRANIRIVEIDAARPIDGALPGIALQPGAELGSYPWLHPVNLGRMADIVAADLERLAPQDAPVLARNLAALKQQLVALSGQTETALLAAPNLTVVSLSPRLDYLASAFNLELVPGSTDPQALAALIRSEGVAAVLHHEEPTPELAQAVTAAGATVVVLASDGQQPVADMTALAARLVQALRPR
ncbi:MAG: zinc ABC transporter substrate-binding protein, partial [Comamonas sp.]|uniref:metal ABC transporter solute-binding protein, Zn/Mn family n=1 Tax=Comamonas sp. TaxID=34028 RepID=UPI002FCC0351